MFLICKLACSNPNKLPWRKPGDLLHTNDLEQPLTFSEGQDTPAYCRMEVCFQGTATHRTVEVLIYPHTTSSYGNLPMQSWLTESFPISSEENNTFVLSWKLLRKLYQFATWPAAWHVTYSPTGIYYISFLIWNGEEKICIYFPIKCTDRGKHPE